MARPAQDEKLPKLGKPVAEPAPVPLRQADHRRGHRDELVGLKLYERRSLGLTHARRGEEERRRDAQDSGETREHGGTRLLDAAGLELGDRSARDADAARELSLSEVQFLARRSHRQCERRP